MDRYNLIKQRIDHNNDVHNYAHQWIKNMFPNIVLIKHMILIILLVCSIEFVDIQKYLNNLNILNVFSISILFFHLISPFALALYNSLMNMTTAVIKFLENRWFYKQVFRDEKNIYLCKSMNAQETTFFLICNLVLPILYHKCTLLL